MLNATLSLNLNRIQIERKLLLYLQAGFHCSQFCVQRGCRKCKKNINMCAYESPLEFSSPHPTIEMDVRVHAQFYKKHQYLSRYFATKLFEQYRSHLVWIIGGGL